MKRLEMRNGDVVDDDRLPWCPECEGFNVPVEGECSACGAAIEWKGEE
jgi:hypothetical protein